MRWSEVGVLFSFVHDVSVFFAHNEQFVIFWLALGLENV